MAEIPSNSELTAVVEDIVVNGDLETLTKKKVFLQCVDKFNCDLTERKQFIYAEVKRAAMEAAAEESAPEEEERTKSGRKKKKKKMKAPKKKRKAPGGFATLCKLSPKMAAFVGAEEMARTQVVSFLCKYIKEHDLQNPNDRRNIDLNKDLKDVLGVDQMTYFSMQKHISPHIIQPPKKEKEAGPPKKKSKRGMNVPQTLSDEIFDIVGKRELSRCALVKALWVYIKANNMQNPDDRRYIRCDDKFMAAFQTNPLHMMTMNKLLSRHLTPIESDTDEPVEGEKVVEGVVKDEKAVKDENAANGSEPMKDENAVNGREPVKEES